VASSLQQGWAENIVGHRASFRQAGVPVNGHMARSCQNFPIQASAAACFQLTGVHLSDFGGDIRLPLHDAFIMNVLDEPERIREAHEQVRAATTAATQQLFPGLAVKTDTDVLECFAKDGKVNSFNDWVGGLEAKSCGSL
ncbi:MAG TPA: hypothetical protein VGP68_02545, partial [Gemmataceae bacterium]|nr:hypothetical protein [Gemmataceae bacterium]